MLVPWTMRPLAAGLATVMLASLALAQSPPGADAERGRALAERLCATCHLGGNVAEKSGPSGVPGFVAVARRPGQTHEGIVHWLSSVPPMMPNHHLTRDEMDHLAAFILSLAAPAK